MTEQGIHIQVGEEMYRWTIVSDSYRQSHYCVAPPFTLQFMKLYCSPQIFHLAHLLGLDKGHETQPERSGMVTSHVSDGHGHTVILVALTALEVSSSY